MKADIERARKLAKEHVEWYQRVTGKLLEEFFVHGHKHGWDDKEKEVKSEEGSLGSLP